MPKKIFELAKELEIGPLDLVEKLKDKGFVVRNHMSSLSDEDVATIMEGFISDAKSKKVASKKKTKKVIKKKAIATKAGDKKAAVKKTTKKASSTIKASAKTDSEVAPKAPRKKIVIRRKSPVKPAAVMNAPVTDATLTSPEISDDINEQQLETATPSTVTLDPAATTDAAPIEKESSTSGLRVISRPEVRVASELDVQREPVTNSSAKEEVVGQTSSGTEIYREKVHKFTPIFIPEPKKATTEETAEKKDQTTTGTSTGTTSQDATKNPTASKRIGGLASMISTKKANVNKSQLITQSRADSELKSYASLSGTGRPIYTQVKRKRIYSGSTMRTEITEIKDAKRVVKIHMGAPVEILAKKLSVKLKELIDKCLTINLLIKNGDYVGLILAQEIAALYDFRVENQAFDEDEALGNKEVHKEVRKKDEESRSPVITIMGHVDHGKTTLIDHIRSAKVAGAEAGGITQHIGAYSVKTKNSQLTFLDTPGHAAFASMRKRGADITDIVILVVAADDGVMPQTKESIKFCQECEVPMIVAINKMDKEGANPDKIKQELSEFGITPEDWGGDTQFCPISALKGDGVDELLEAIALQAEILELRAVVTGPSEGVVIESNIESGRGAMATILIQSGKLKKGDSIVVGECYGRARSLTNHLGEEVKSAGPSTPVQIFGLSDCPSPGDKLNGVKNEREAKKIVTNRIDERELNAEKTVVKKISLEDFFATPVEDSSVAKELKLIIRTDVQGSYEAIKQSLQGLETDEVFVNIIGGGVGPITESDVTLAESSSAFLIGFNMRPLTNARKNAERLGLDIKTYSIIYELLNDVKLAMEGLLDPEFVEEFIGRAEVKEPFNIPKIGVIAGSVVIDGKIKVGCNVRLLRNGKILFDGKMSSLRRFKDDVKEVRNGLECGIGLEDYNDIEVADLFEAYFLNEKKRTLEDVENDMAKKAKLEAKRLQDEAAKSAEEAAAATTV